MMREEDLGGNGIFIRRDGKRIKMAEREGFEPSVQFKLHNALAGRHLQPLGHLSKGMDTVYHLPEGRVNSMRAA